MQSRQQSNWRGSALTSRPSSSDGKSTANTLNRRNSTLKHASKFARRDYNFATVLGIPRVSLEQAFKNFNL